MIHTEGVRVFRQQPGFVRYRLMLADPTTWQAGGAALPGVAKEQRDSREAVFRDLRRRSCGGLLSNRTSEKALLGSSMNSG